MKEKKNGGEWVLTYLTLGIKVQSQLSQFLVLPTAESSSRLRLSVKPRGCPPSRLVTTYCKAGREQGNKQASINFHGETLDAAYLPTCLGVTAVKMLFR